MTYDLSRFSSASFEEFAQALIVSKLGPGVQVFGQGPDGAREATYNGPVPISTDGQPWDGYVVIQAKYRTSEDPKLVDYEWLKRQIDGELEKFTSPRRQLRIPDYYLVLTNARLTPGAANSDGKGAGGIDLIEAHLAGWSQKIPLKDGKSGTPTR